MHILQEFTLTVVYVYRIVRPRQLVYAVAEHRDALTEFAARKPHHDIGLAGLEIDTLQHRLAPLARAFPQHAVDILQSLRIARPQMGIYGLYVVSVHYGLHRFRERRTAAVVRDPHEATPAHIIRAAMKIFIIILFFGRTAIIIFAKIQKNMNRTILHKRRAALRKEGRT